MHIIHTMSPPPCTHWVSRKPLQYYYLPPQYFTILFIFTTSCLGNFLKFRFIARLEHWDGDVILSCSRAPTEASTNALSAAASLATLMAGLFAGNGEPVSVPPLCKPGCKTGTTAVPSTLPGCLSVWGYRPVWYSSQPFQYPPWNGSGTLCCGAQLHLTSSPCQALVPALGNECSLDSIWNPELPGKAIGWVYSLCHWIIAGMSLMAPIASLNRERLVLAPSLSWSMLTSMQSKNLSAMPVIACIISRCSLAEWLIIWSPIRWTTDTCSRLFLRSASFNEGERSDRATSGGIAVGDEHRYYYNTWCAVAFLVINLSKHYASIVNCEQYS